MKEEKRVVSIIIPTELWDLFYKKYRKNSSEVIRGMIRKDLEEN